MDSTHGKQNKMDRSYHKLILRSLIAIAGVGILITGISLSSFFLSRLNRNVEDYNNAHLRNVQDEIAGMKDFVSQTGSLLVQDSLTKKYLHAQRSVDYVELGQLLDRIRATAAMKDYIDSVYLIYPGRDLALTSFGLFSWDTFQDKTWLNVADPSKAVTWQGGHQILTDKTIRIQTSVVSAIFMLSWYYPGRDGYLIINISEEQLYGILGKGDYRNSTLILTDKQGDCITGTPDLPFTNERDREILMEQLQADGSEMIASFNGNDYLTTLRTDSRDGWQYYILTPLSEANAYLFQSAIYILLVLAAAVTVSYIMSLRLRNHAYVPVTELVESSGAKTPESEEKQRQYTEFQQISHRFHSILLEKYNMENQIHTMLPVLKERFFGRLLSGQLIQKEDFESQLNLLGLDLSVYESYMVFCVQAEIPQQSVSRDNNRRQKEEHWLSILSVKRKAEEIYKTDDRLLCCVEHNINQLNCVAAFHSGDAPKKALLHILELPAESLPDGVTLTMGIGNPVRTPDALQISTNQALEALEQNNLYGKNQILFFSDIYTQTNLSYINPLSYEKALISAMKIHDFSEIHTILDHADYLLCDNHYNLRMIRHFYLGIINFISEFNEEGKSTHSVDEDAFRCLSDSIYRLESLAEIRQTVEDACQKAAEAFRIAGQKRAKTVAKQICRYLEEHYMQELSLDSVAEHFHFTGTYINRLLKQYREATFYDILTEQRITKAKELLEDTELQVYQIAMFTGYTNVQSFIRMFKKVTGTTPGAFRKEKIRKVSVSIRFAITMVWPNAIK